VIDMAAGGFVKGYLRFLLRYRATVAFVIGLGTLWLSSYTPRIFTNFFDLYPPRHPYIQLYNQYRGMFGTANTLLLALEVQNGTIFDDPETIRKVDRITLALLHEVPGVNGEQVLSITHPKLKTTLTSGSGIKTVPLTYPRLPEDAQDLEFFKQKVYATEGVRGFFVSEDDTVTLITAGFWEEHFDLIGMWRRLQDVVRQEEDDNTRIYVTGVPVLFAYFHEAMSSMLPVLLATTAAMVVLLWVHFRSVQGVLIPLVSGSVSAVWGLGFAGLCGFNIDPLVLVVPVLITARALSHSVQSLERYHEEYRRTGNKSDAITKSYTGLFPPAMVAVASDGLAILTIAVASIPIMQKLAYVASFWVASIFLSVITLHPIILSYAPAPGADVDPRRALANGLGMVAVGAGALAWVALDAPLGRVGQWAEMLSCPETGVVVMLLAVLAVPVFLFIRLLAYRGLARLDVSASRRGLALLDRLGLVLAALLVGACVWNGMAALGAARQPPVLAAGLAAVCVLLAWRRLGWTVEDGLVWLSSGRVRYVVLASVLVAMATGHYFARHLKVGNMTPGAALLYADHPYNLAFDKVNEKFVGASALIIIAEGKEPGAIKRASTLRHLDLFGRYMEQGAGTGGSLTATTLLKKVFRTFHEGDPKWEMLPTRDDHVGQLFFLLTSATRRGEMDRFFDESYTNATIAIYYKSYDNAIIHDAIGRAKTYIREYTSDSEPVRYRLAGGLLGILGAVNEEVEWSYRVNICLILLVVFVLSAATYWTPGGACVLGLLGSAAFAWWQLPWLLSWTGMPVMKAVLGPVAGLRGVAPAANPALWAFVAYILWHWRSLAGAVIVMAPSLVAQPLSEAVMYVMGIDFSVNSLPVAAVGIGIGIDYGYYVLSRIREEVAVDRDYDAANRRALHTTGRAVLFTGATLVTSVVFWLFFPMKFQAEMALLLAMLLVFHVVGALVVIPTIVSLLHPRFVAGDAPA
jgi:predicted RND superfamily exporter protein